MIGQRLGPYEITAKLGEGGMGEVYRAHDTKLKRDVAIKVLPQGFTEDKERLARFEREAQLLAQLHHPNIASIFGMEESTDGTRALVMELVEGPTLAERLEAGPFSFNECLSVCVQIAHALEEAHEKGIVHRDLKPQNIKASPEGRTKVLDFGLAKAMDPAAGSAASAADLARSPTLMQSPTLTAVHGTELGVILGTAAYMAPEQAKGLAIDKRADIWAFGVVMFEMLVGRSLFAGDTVTDVLADVLRREIDFDALPPSTPPAVRRLLRRCLERNPKNRLHDIADARIVLEEVLAGKADEPVSSAAGAPAPASPSARSGLYALLAIGLIALGVVGDRLVSRSARGASAASAGSLRPAFRQLTKMPGGEGSPTLAPDGESLVYVKRDGGDLDLFSQRVDGTTAIALTAGCDQDDFDPALSPDGRRIAFRSECDGGGIFVMGATGEALRRVSELGFAPAWSPDGQELAVVTERLEGPTSRQSTSQLWAVRVDSGERRRVSEHDAMGPTWSPDGRRIAFWGLKGDTFQRDLWSVAADGSQSAAEAAVAIVDDPPLDWAPAYSRDGRWLYFSSSRGGTYNLWRFALDPATGEPAGAPEPVTAPSSSTGLFALSADGRRIVYVDVNMRTEIVRAPFDPSRRALAAAPVPVFSGSFELREQQLSPAGDWIVFTNEDPPQQLHLVRPDGTGYRQLTSDSERHRQADFSPDGAWIVFQTTRGGAALAAIRTDGGSWQTVTSTRGLSQPRWSPDGSTIAAFDNQTGAVLLDVRSGLSAAPSRDLPPVAEGVLFWPRAWSPDGALLAGFGNREGQNTSVVVRSTTSGEYRTVAPRLPISSFGSLTFLNRHLLAFASGQAISLFDLERAGAPEPFYAPRPGFSLTNVHASRDGRWLTWIERADESDIWLLTLDDGAASDADGRPAR